MKQLAGVAMIVCAFAGCGGKTAPKPIDNAGPPTPTAAVAMPSGIHGCMFVIDDFGYGPHRCDVSAGKVEKVSGMEPFSGTLSPSGDGSGLKLEATMGCGEMTTNCKQAFSAELHKDGNKWRGKVMAEHGGEASWFLTNSTFELDDDTGYGGQYYGMD